MSSIGSVLTVAKNPPNRKSWMFVESLNNNHIFCLDPSLSALCNASGCEYCRGNITLATVDCFCPDGYTINGDGTTCDGTDFCKFIYLWC